MLCKCGHSEAQEGTGLCWDCEEEMLADERRKEDAKQAELWHHVVDHLEDKTSRFINIETHWVGRNASHEFYIGKGKFAGRERYFRITCGEDPDVWNIKVYDDLESILDTYLGHS